MHRPSNAARLPPRAAWGFTLLELVVVIAVIGILAAAIAPAVMQQILESRVEGTRSEVRTIHDAMVGRPAEGQFGFAGDIGRLPVSLQELTAPGGLPSYTTNTVRNVGIGWRGPYVNTGLSAGDYLTDAFGRAYSLSGGQVRSPGPDGVANTADDIVFPPASPAIAGDIVVTVKTSQGAKIFVDPNGYRVDLYYAQDGAEASLSDDSRPFSFSNVPMGIRAIQVVKTGNPGADTVVSEDTIVVRPGSTTAAELWF